MSLGKGLTFPTTDMLYLPCYCMKCLDTKLHVSKSSLMFLFLDFTWTNIQVLGKSPALFCCSMTSTGWRQWTHYAFFVLCIHKKNQYPRSALHNFSCYCDIYISKIKLHRMCRLWSASIFFTAFFKTFFFIVINKSRDCWLQKKITLKLQYLGHFSTEYNVHYMIVLLLKDEMNFLEMEGLVVLSTIF